MTKVSLLPASATSALQKEVTGRLLSILDRGKAEKGETDEGDVGILTEYVWHLLNKEDEDKKSLLTKELREFLQIHTDEFVDWLMEILEAQTNNNLEQEESIKDLNNQIQEGQESREIFEQRNWSAESPNDHTWLHHSPNHDTNRHSIGSAFRRSNSKTIGEQDHGRRHRSRSNKRYSSPSRRHSGSSSHRHRSSKSSKYGSSRHERDNSNRRHRSREDSSHSSKSRKRSLGLSDRSSRDKEKQRGRILGLAVEQATKTSQGNETIENSHMSYQGDRSRSRSRSPIISRSIAISSAEPTNASVNDGSSAASDDNFRAMDYAENSKQSNGMNKIKAVLKPNPRFTLTGNALPLQQPLVVMYGTPSGGLSSSISSVSSIPFHIPKNSGNSQTGASMVAPVPVDMEIDLMQQATAVPVETGQSPSVAESSQGQIRKRCSRWPNCPFGSNCLYVHPSAKCKNWPNCPFGSTCFYWHPNVPCKYGSDCQNEYCNYSHVLTGNATSNPDFFGERTSAGIFKNKTWTSNIEEDAEKISSDTIATLQDAVTSLSTTLPGTPPELKKCRSSEVEVSDIPQLPSSNG